MNKRKLDIYLMVGALLFMIIGIPGMIYVANGWNSFLSQSYDYDQMDNVTAFYNGPLYDGKSTEGRYASMLPNGTGITAETPVWDTTGEWDTVTLTGVGVGGANTTLIMVFNLNKSADDLLQSKYYSFRVKTNSTASMVMEINAVKYDGVKITEVNMLSAVQLDAGLRINYLNWTPTEVLNWVTTLNPDTTDETYIQVVFSSSTTPADNLTTGDTIQFEYSLGSPGNVYTYSASTILNGVGIIGGITFLLIGFASTPAWNPLAGGGLVGKAQGKAKASYRRRKAKKRSN